MEGKDCVAQDSNLKGVIVVVYLVGPRRPPLPLVRHRHLVVSPCGRGGGSR